MTGRTAEIVLASGSKARREMLAAAGVHFTVQAADVDEPAIRARLLAEDKHTPPKKIAEVLAIAKAAFDADLVINVPKLKTHAFTLFTNAVKNVFGLLPGFQKMLLHKSFPNPRQFGECLAFLYKTVKPGLTVCDAVVGMEGDGPSGGTPVQLGFLAASADQETPSAPYTFLAMSSTCSRNGISRG